MSFFFCKLPLNGVGIQVGASKKKRPAKPFHKFQKLRGMPTIVHEAKFITILQQLVL